SNSTFSWWIAWLGEKQTTRVICPIKNFNNKIKNFNDKDFYPDRWEKFNPEREKIPLKYFQLILRGESYLFKKFVINKFRGLKKRLNKLLSQLSLSFLIFIG